MQVDRHGNVSGKLTNATIKSGQASGSSISFVAGNFFGNTSNFSGTIRGSSMGGTYRQSAYGGTCTWEAARTGDAESVSEGPARKKNPPHIVSGAVNVPVCGGRGSIQSVVYNTKKQSGFLQIKMRDGTHANLNVGPSPRKKVSSASGLADAYGDLIDEACKPSRGEASLVNVFGGAIRSFVIRHLLTPDEGKRKRTLKPGSAGSGGIRG